MSCLLFEWNMSNESMNSAAESSPTQATSTETTDEDLGEVRLPRQRAPPSSADRRLFCLFCLPACRTRCIIDYGESKRVISNFLHRCARREEKREREARAKRNLRAVTFNEIEIKIDQINQPTIDARRRLYQQHQKLYLFDQPL